MTDHGLFDPSNPSAKIVQKYRLGVVIDPMPGDERFEGWLAIPYLTMRGIKAMRFRNLKDDGGAKYGQAKGQSTRLYNPAALFGRHIEIGIAEGEMDTIAACEGLGLPTVGIPGATQWKGHARIWASLFKDFERVFILKDGDTAGADMAEAVSETLKLKARTIDMPEGMDVSKMLKQGRADELTRQFKEDIDDEDDDEWQF